MSFAIRSIAGPLPLAIAHRGGALLAPENSAEAFEQAKAVGAEVAGQVGEWSADEVYIALARPGGDAWVSIDRATGAVEHEKTTRGAISLLNDLRKGRNAGKAWGWFIDIFAGACVVFTITGLIRLQFHARSRPLTWPLVGLGLVIPVILVILFVHL